MGAELAWLHCCGQSPTSAAGWRSRACGQSEARSAWSLSVHVLFHAFKCAAQPLSRRSRLTFQEGVLMRQQRPAQSMCSTSQEHVKSRPCDLLWPPAAHTWHVHVSGALQHGHDLPEPGHVAKQQLMKTGCPCLQPAVHAWSLPLHGTLPATAGQQCRGFQLAARRQPHAAVIAASLDKRSFSSSSTSLRPVSLCLYVQY